MSAGVMAAGSWRRRDGGQNPSAHFVQIACDKHTESTNFVGRFVQVGHHDRHHAGGRGGANAVVRVLQRQAKPRLDAKKFSRLQEWIGRRFALLVVAVADDVGKPLDQSKRGQMTRYCATRRGGGDGGSGG